MFYDNKDDELKNEENITENEEANNKEENTPENDGSAINDGEHTEETGYSGYNHDFDNGKKPEKPEKPRNDSYMSKKTVGLIVALCLVLSIICGVCASAVTQAFRDGKLETTENAQSSTVVSGSEKTETTSDSSTSVIPVEPVDTTGAVAIPTVSPATGGTRYGSYADVVEKCINSVVQIEVTEEATSVFYGTYETKGAGSGVIYTTDGYIITNYHVAGASTKSITVILYDGTRYEGQFICGDESMDLSVIKISKDDCVAAQISDSASVRLGEDVIAIGNPLGYGITVTPGIVSALSRTVTIENTTMVLMQTSAAINSGNSGGGLFNMKGELIGITNAKVGGTSVEAMGYAIPSEKVIKCINDFANYGYVTGIARFGVGIRNYVQIGRMTYSGLISVSSIVSGGTADVCGIKINDIIYAVNGTECTSFANLTKILTKYKVGDTVTVTVLRPTIEASSAASYNSYLKSCEEVQLQVTFVEFNPGN